MVSPHKQLTDLLESSRFATYKSSQHQPVAKYQQWNFTRAWQKIQILFFCTYNKVPTRDFLFQLIHPLPNVYQSKKKESTNIFIHWCIQALCRLFKPMYNTILHWYLSSTETCLLALLPFVRIPRLNDACILNSYIKQLHLFLESYVLISGDQGHFRQTALQIDSAESR